MENKLSDYSELKDKITNIEKLNKYYESNIKQNTKILKDSSIFQYSEEVQLLSNAISPDKHISFQLVYSSKLTYKSD